MSDYAYIVTTITDIIWWTFLKHGKGSFNLSKLISAGLKELANIIHMNFSWMFTCFVTVVVKMTAPFIRYDWMTTGSAASQSWFHSGVGEGEYEKIKWGLWRVWGYSNCFYCVLSLCIVLLQKTGRIFYLTSTLSHLQKTAAVGVEHSSTDCQPCVHLLLS